MLKTLEPLAGEAFLGRVFDGWHLVPPSLGMFTVFVVALCSVFDAQRCFHFNFLEFHQPIRATHIISHLLTTVLSGFGFVLPIFWGKTFFPLLPRSGGLNTIYGRVIHLPTIHDPTFEDLVKWHVLYVEELKSMFDEYKVKFGFGDRELHCF
jgi:hypothetical protein